MAPPALAPQVSSANPGLVPQNTEAKRRDAERKKRDKEKERKKEGEREREKEKQAFFFPCLCEDGLKLGTRNRIN